MILIALLAQLNDRRKEKARQSTQRCRDRWTPGRRDEVNRLQAEKARLLRRQLAAQEGRTLRVPAKTPEERKRRTKLAQERYATQNRQKRRKQWCDYAKRNRAKIEAYRSNRYRTDPQWNLAVKTRRRIWDAFDRCRDGKDPESKSIKLLGCSFAELRDHIEKLFTEGMTWEKVLSGEIHLDHKRPICKYDLTDPAQLAAAFHYSNVQPLWGPENHSKGGKYTEPVTA